MDVSFSTMWARNNFPELEDFLKAAQRLGFAQVELNHDINSDMLSGIDFSAYSISSVHEPCPADISTRELKSKDWLISSINEENRARGVKSIERSIDLAYEIGAPLVVVHAGQVTGDLTLEKRLRALIESGQSDSTQAAAVRAEMFQFRAETIEPHFQAVKKSLSNLLEYANPRKICLGLENRFHYTDIPSPWEMAILLEMGSPNELGMVFDTGHAQVLQQLGFFGFSDWIELFLSRIVSVHLHDVNCLTDHAVPGTGEVDFQLLSSCLPQSVLKTFEIRGSHSSAQIRTGMNWMVRNGWLKHTTSKPCEV
jgi:sugar phosphate isomerase/epimerase